MAIEVKVRKWGNSFGVILPKQLVEHQELKEEDLILIEVVKEGNLKHLFGTLKSKMSGQEFKDMVREGWE